MSAGTEDVAPSDPLGVERSPSSKTHPKTGIALHVVIIGEPPSFLVVVCWLGSPRTRGRVPSDLTDRPDPLASAGAEKTVRAPRDAQSTCAIRSLRLPRCPPPSSDADPATSSPSWCRWRRRTRDPPEPVLLVCS